MPRIATTRLLQAKQCHCTAQISSFRLQPPTSLSMIMSSTAGQPWARAMSSAVSPACMQRIG